MTKIINSKEYVQKYMLYPQSQHLHPLKNTSSSHPFHFNNTPSSISKVFPQKQKKNELCIIGTCDYSVVICVWWLFVHQDTLQMDVSQN